MVTGWDKSEKSGDAAPAPPEMARYLVARP